MEAPGFFKRPPDLDFLITSKRECLYYRNGTPHGWRLSDALIWSMHEAATNIYDEKKNVCVPMESLDVFKLLPNLSFLIISRRVYPLEWNRPSRVETQRYSHPVHEAACRSILQYFSSVPTQVEECGF